MQNFYVTFGQRYRREPHPADDRAHPDGYFVVEAPTELEARALLFRLLGPAWSMIYTEKEWKYNAVLDGDFYPRGELARLSTEDL